MLTFHNLHKNTLCIFQIAVNQVYSTKAEDEYVIMGNDVLKCKIPSFVSDFVEVVGWIETDTGKELRNQLSKNSTTYWQYRILKIWIVYGKKYSLLAHHEQL